MIGNAVLLALRAIRRNLLRSALTVLGIVIGVAAVITMVTIGNGATAKVSADIASLGSNLVQVRPGQGHRGPGGTRLPARAFTVADVEAIEREVSGLAAVAPVVSRASQAIYGNQNLSTTVIGSNDAYLQVRNWQLADGRIFHDSEQRAGQAVCVLGNTVREELFGAQPAVGEVIRLQNLSCSVIGTLQPKGQSSFGSDQDDFVLVPMRTVQRRLIGNPYVHSIQVSVQEGVGTQQVTREIEHLLRERRRVGSNNDNFRVTDMQEIAATMTGSTQVLTGLLGAVAAVSLLVGGIGIMNIMLVSVTERTREIGIRLAIGALEREVLTQFLVEAVVLSSIGGIIGIVLGVGAAAVGVAMLEVPFVLDPGIIVTAFIFSALVGVVFGFFPARRAARLDPIDALRYE